MPPPRFFINEWSMENNEENRAGKLAWLKIPDRGSWGCKRWSVKLVNRIVEIFVNNKQKNSKYSYKDACEALGWDYNRTNGVWQKRVDDKKRSLDGERQKKSPLCGTEFWAGLNGVGCHLSAPLLQLGPRCGENCKHAFFVVASIPPQTTRLLHHQGTRLCRCPR